ncbi:MAG: hypothetical protein ACOYLQ_16370 [Hyphomicrobiaceae bacterium]
MPHALGPSDLPAIPVIRTGPSFAVETLAIAGERTRALLDLATRHIPHALLRVGDAVSRHWLVKSRNPYLTEIDAVAAWLRRPGAYFFTVNYEWGCTCRVAPAEDHASARLVRVLDWRTPGLGRYVVAAEVTAPAGRYVSLTWPGYTGVLQALAPGRFAAAINQAPMRKFGGGFRATDWAANRVRVWRRDHLPAAHLLRDVFETATGYADARRRLIATPIAAPAIFSLAGLGPDDTCVIERTEDEASVHDGPRTAANHWQAHGWTGHGRGLDSHGRARSMDTVGAALNPDFAWLAPPVLNPLTRLAMVASPFEGRLVAQGFEADGRATAPLVWQA